MDKILSKKIRISIFGGKNFKVSKIKYLDLLNKLGFSKMDLNSKRWKKFKNSFLKIKKWGKNSEFRLG